MQDNRTEPRAKGVGTRLTRRQACHLMGGVSIGMAAATQGAAAVVDRPAGMGGIRYVVSDRRYPESLAFARSLAERGAVRLEVTDGLTRLWRDALAPLWGGRDGMVVGLTLPQTWQGLAEQARGAGRRSILVGHHATAPAGEMLHSVALAGAAPGPAALLDRCGQMWPQAMADFITGYTAGPRPAGRTCNSGRGGLPLHASRALTSWIIA